MAYTTIKNPKLYFNTKLYTGNSSTNAITGVGFQPDWVWMKNRGANDSHYLFDAVRGVTKSLYSNNTSAEDTRTNSLTAFGTDGFTLGNEGDINGNGNNYVAWNWKANGAGSANTDGSINSTVSANTTSGFSIVSYTGSGANATVGHGLGSVPKMIIVKQYSSNGGTQNWYVYHASLGNNKDLLLNLTNDASNTVTTWNNTTPTSSVFYLGSGDGVNNNTVSYIAYCFAEKTGYSKFGSYAGNGNVDGSFIYTGFKPAFVMAKATTDSGQSWYMHDNKRNPHNVCGLRLFANLTNADTTNGDSGGLDFLSNGFKIRTTDGSTNASGQTRIFMAFAEEPLVGDNPATAR